jgi:hypothetical protein
MILPDGRSHQLSGEFHHGKRNDDSSRGRSENKLERRVRVGPKVGLGGWRLQERDGGVKDLVKRGIADPNRLGIGGWSYGGYMAE